MRLHFTVFGPIVANDRIGAFKMANGLVEEIEKRTGQKFGFTIGDENAPGSEYHGTQAPGGRAQAGADFPDDEASARGRADEGRVRGGGDEAGGNDGAEQPKRGRGRPPGPAKAGKAAEGPERDQHARGDGHGAAAEGGGRDGAERTAQGEGEGRGGRAEGARDARRGDAPAAGNRGGDQGEAHVADDDDWGSGDDQPVYTISDVTMAMTALFNAMGGENGGVKRSDVMKIVTAETGFSQVKDIPEAAFAGVVSKVNAQRVLYERGDKKYGK